MELIFIPFFLLFNFPIWGVNKHRKLGVSDSKYANELAHCTSVIVEPNLNSNDFNYIFLHHLNIQNDSFIVSLLRKLSHSFTCIGRILNFASCCNFNAKTNIYYILFPSTLYVWYVMYTMSQGHRKQGAKERWSPLDFKDIEKRSEAEIDNLGLSVPP